MALVTALLISVILFILGTAFLSFIGNDYYFAGKEQNNAEAFYLAKAGMEYYANMGFPPGWTQSGNIKSGRINIPLTDPSRFCIISQNLATGDMTFAGTITDFWGNALTKRSIVAPGGSLSQWYEQ